MLRIIEDQYIMTSQDYVANAPSDNVKGDVVRNMEPIINPVDSKECVICAGGTCNCDKEDPCQNCIDHFNGKHKVQINQSKAEELLSIIEGLDADSIKDSYWEVTSVLDKAYFYAKRYNVPFKKGDIAFVIKQKIPKSKIKDYKKLFDKHALPALKAELIDSGPEWYLFRPKKASKLAKFMIKKGDEFKGVLSAALGLSGLGIFIDMGKDIYKSQKEK